MATFKVSVAGYEFKAHADESVLQAAERSGFALPYQCRVGSCGKCRCTLEEGEVQALVDPAYTLTAKAMEAKQILLCQSRANSDISLVYKGNKAPVKILAHPKVSTGSAQSSSNAGWWDYLKFSSHLFIGLFSSLALLLGTNWISAYLFFVVAFYVLGDLFCGHDHRIPVYRQPLWLDIQLYASLPVTFLVVLALLWQLSPGDVFGIGEIASQWLDIDVLANKAATTWPNVLGAFLLTGLMIGLMATVPAHELVHRTWHPFSMVVGRWLLAFSFDTSFSVEHVYGHHRYVATAKDPATAPRGRNVYHHIVSSTWRGYKSAWQIEQTRLRHLSYGRWSWHNRVIRGYLMTLSLLVFAQLCFGWVGVATLMMAGLLGKSMLEIVNYMEHYGLVRVLGEPVAPRHSWNSTKRLSSWSMYNLTRHSHHHAQGDVPFHGLHPMPCAPQMINGYLSTLLLTLIPPLWFRLMRPKLAYWDAHYATPAELKQLAPKKTSSPTA